MKRFIIWALALYATATTALAQNNSYSMVITMTNGTTITLGPNDVKTITFKDGEVQVTGQALDQLVEKTKENNSEILNLSKRVINLEDALAASKAKCDEDISKVNQRTNDIIKLLSDQDGNIMQVEKDVRSLTQKLDSFENLYGPLSEAFGVVNQRVSNLEDAMKAMKIYVDSIADQLK